MNLVTTKILVAVLSGAVRLFFGLLPIKIFALIAKWEKQDDGAAFTHKKRHQQVKCGLEMAQSFGGGVLFATCMLHMMPEVHDSVEYVKKYTGTQTNYPLSQLMVCLGFLTIYFVEETSHWIISNIPQDPVCTQVSSRAISPNQNKVSPQIEKVEQIDIFTIEDAMNEKELESLKNADLDTALDVEKMNQKNLELMEELETAEEKEVIDEVVEKEVKTKQQLFRGIVVIAALSLHALLEGLAIGLQYSNANIWYLFVAVSIHSATILFCITLELLLAKTRMRIIFVHILILSITSPAGIITGLLITLHYDMNTKAKSTAVAFLEGLSAGTLLYITFFEVLNREKERRVYRLRRAVCILAGFGLMAILQCISISSNL